MKVINVTNLDNNTLNLDRTDRHISISEFMQMYQHFAIDAGDIVMASSGNSYSKTAVVRQQDLPLVMNTSVIRFKPLKGYDYKFLWALLNSPLFKNQIDLMITGGAQPNFGPYHLKRVNVPVPPTKAEQIAIATALSDVDALLDGLDRLIAKKRALKQAAMQGLLTPPAATAVESGEWRVENEDSSSNSQLSTLNSPFMRLPGFEGEWEVKRIDHIADIRSGGTPSTAQPRFWDGGIPWCTPTDITALGGKKYLSETTRTISAVGLRSSSAETVPRHSIIMTSRATIGECAINTVPMTTNQGFKNLIPRNDVDTEFLYYLMTMQTDRLIQLCGGSTFLEIGKKQLSGFEVKLPCDPDEQTAIAAVLSDMDAEIEALEQRRAKTAELKQAMMQDLLTGKTRLIN